MKVIFLDIDGVLNSHRSAKAFDGFPWPTEPRDWHKFDEIAIKLLQIVVQKTGAVVVLSSTWRLELDEQGIKDLSKRLEVPIVDKTRPDKEDYITFQTEPRGAQIQDWLNDHPEVTKWAILDDRTDFLPHQSPNFVQTDLDTGLGIEEFGDLIRILSD